MTDWHCTYLTYGTRGSISKEATTRAEMMQTCLKRLCFLQRLLHWSPRSRKQMRAAEAPWHQTRLQSSCSMTSPTSTSNCPSESRSSAWFSGSCSRTSCYCSTHGSVVSHGTLGGSLCCWKAAKSLQNISLNLIWVIMFRSEGLVWISVSLPSVGVWSCVSYEKKAKLFSFHPVCQEGLSCDQQLNEVQQLHHQSEAEQRRWRLKTQSFSCRWIFSSSSWNLSWEWRNMKWWSLTFFIKVLSSQFLLNRRRRAPQTSRRTRLVRFWRCRSCFMCFIWKLFVLVCECVCVVKMHK